MTKHGSPVVNLRSRVGPVTTISVPSNSAATSIALPNRDDKIDSTYDHFGQDLHQHVRGIQRNDFQFDGFKSSMASCDWAPAAVLCDKTGGIYSQPCKLLSFNYLIISENLILVRLLQSTTQQ